MSAAKLWTLYQPIMTFLTQIGTMLIWLIGGYQLLNAELTHGEIVLFTIYMTQFLQPVRTLAQMNRRFLRAATSAERVFEILDTPPSVASRKDAVNLPSMRGQVEFRDVFFSYDDEKNAINGISFTTQPGGDDRTRWT